MRKLNLLHALFAALVAAGVVSGQPDNTALVRRSLVLNGAVEGSIQLLTPENVALGGGVTVSGDLLMPGLPTVQLNGKPKFAGTRDSTGAASPTSHRVTLSG